jgi:hypothetical protein
MHVLYEMYELEALGGSRVHLSPHIFTLQNSERISIKFDTEDLTSEDVNLI